MQLAILLLVILNLIITVSIANALVRLIAPQEESDDSYENSHLVDLPSRRSYADQQLQDEVPNWDGVSPLPRNFDGVTYEEE